MSGSDAIDSFAGTVFRRRWIMPAGALVAGVVLIVFRLHAFGLPLETDEGNYAYIGARLLEGDRLYLDVWDHQPPGIFVFFAGIIALFGDAPIVFRVTACACSLASMLLIAGLLRRLVGTSAAIAGMFLFAVVSSDPGTAGEGCQREIYMNTLLLAAWYLALGASRRKLRPSSSENTGGQPTEQTISRSATNMTFVNAASSSTRDHEGDASRRSVRVRWMLFSSGLCLAVASFIKTVVAVHWLALAVWSIPTWIRINGSRRSRFVGEGCTSLFWFGLGPLLVWIGTFAYFAATERWTEFIDAAFVFNLGYSGGVSWPARFAGFLTPDRHPFVFDSAMPLWIAGAIATFVIVMHSILSIRVRQAWVTTETIRRPQRAGTSGNDRQAASGGWSVLLLIVASFVAVCLPGRSWPHYYYLMIPPLVIGTLYAIGLVARRIEAAWPSPSGGVRVAVTVMAFSGVFLPTLHTQYRDYLSQPPFGITVKRYNSRDFWGQGQGENVRRITQPADAVFVFGNEASIYYYARRRCASRYTMLTGLADGMPGAERRRAILMNELRANPPRVLLVLFDQQPFEEWKRFLNEHYGEPIGWDLHDQSRQPIMFVLARRDAPVEGIDWDWDRASVGGWMLGDQPARSVR